MATVNPFLYDDFNPYSGYPGNEVPPTSNYGATTQPVVPPVYAIPSQRQLEQEPWYRNPNTYRIMGEAAGAIAPGTIGDRLGQVGSKAIGAIEQQKKAEAAEKERQERYKQLIETLGGVTPKGQPGVTNFKIDPDGGINIGMDLPQSGNGATPVTGTATPETPSGYNPALPGYAPMPTAGPLRSSQNGLIGPATGNNVTIAELLPFLFPRNR